jgi:hypothetical protein
MISDWRRQKILGCRNPVMSSDPADCATHRSSDAPRGAPTGCCRPRQRAPERCPRYVTQEMLRPRPSNSPCCARRKDRLRCPERPKSKEETPKEGSGSGRPSDAPQQQPQRRSDSAKLSFEIYGGFWLRFVGSMLENHAKASDFQAEYEGSIPFTRSSLFRYFIGPT